ncbi:hypothetical protein [Fusobacterium varium]|uniref:hypothetical protein n=1 Tax=Fusobacterium varium TaxID=856 RepID=UPI0035641D4C
MLPSSGTIKMSEVRTELKTIDSINLGRIDVRNLAEKPTGIIKMSDLHGKASYIWEGQLTIGYDNGGIGGVLYGYSSANGTLIPKNFNSLTFENFGYIVNNMLYGSGILVSFLGNINTYSYLIININKKTYKLMPSILNSYLLNDQLEVLEYFKLNVRKTIQVYIVEAKLK